MEIDYICGRTDILVRQLGDVDKSILMNTYIHEGSKLGDVGDNAWQYHSHREIVYALNTDCKLEFFYLIARVATRLLQLVHDVGEGGHSHCVGDITLEVDSLA